MKHGHESFQDEFADIARYEVSEDGIAWRPYNPAEDNAKILHKRIEFALDDEASAVHASF